MSRLRDLSANGRYQAAYDGDVVALADLLEACLLRAPKNLRDLEFI